MSEPFVHEGVERLPVRRFAEKAYLDYSMYVILDRALPHIADGLKPVQRRIVYAMSELGLSAAAKYKKSARAVGDVLGKFHPHGDTACYEAMVLMAQPFSFRYPLIDGQGNWGSIDDPKSFAAMRYTEARLTAFADLLLAELGQGTIDWTANFDGTLQEPTLLPARLPHVLLNGAAGIAVGMATDIPPHNLREIAAACVHLLDHPEADVAALCGHVQAPDFPTEAAIVTGPEELRALYRTGAGSIRMRARYEIEGQAVVVTALPYQVSGARVLEQIAAQMNARKLPWVEDLRDESDHENPVRLLIVTRSNRVDCDRLMSHLFATTDLERSYRVNMNMIGVDGRPKLKNLREILSEWLGFREQVVRRRLGFRLQRVTDRLHVLEGLLVAFLNIDEVIAIIRAEEQPKAALIARFALSEAQAEAILELRLRHLARLEEQRIRAERDALGAERAHLESLLASPQRVRALIREEILGDAERYGDARRSPLSQGAPASAFGEAELAPAEAVTVVLSQKGWVRAAKGHDVEARGFAYRSGDAFQCAAPGRSNQVAVFIDSTGRSYSLAAHTLPSARGLGEPLSGRLNPPDGARFAGVMLGAEEELWLLASDAGYGFLAALGDLHAKNRAGKAILSVPAGAEVLLPQRVAAVQGTRIAVASSAGRLLVFAANELPRLARGKGLKLMAIPAARARAREEFVRAIAVLDPGASLTVHAGRRFVTLRGADLANYELGRGRRGGLLPRGLQRVDALVSGEDGLARE